MREFVQVEGSARLSSRDRRHDRFIHAKPDIIMAEPLAASQQAASGPGATARQPLRELFPFSPFASPLALPPDLPSVLPSSCGFARLW